MTEASSGRVPAATALHQGTMISYIFRPSTQVSVERKKSLVNAISSSPHGNRSHNSSLAFAMNPSSVVCTKNTIFRMARPLHDVQFIPQNLNQKTIARTQTRLSESARHPHHLSQRR